LAVVAGAFVTANFYATPLLQKGQAAWTQTMYVSDGPARCADGWNSPSIGKQGACSWHGGVVYPSHLEHVDHPATPDVFGPTVLVFGDAIRRSLVALLFCGAFTLWYVGRSQHVA
jgi:hypothetical protein